MSKNKKKKLTPIYNDPRNPEGVIGNNDIFQMLQKITNGDLNNKVMETEFKTNDFQVVYQKQERLTPEEYLEMVKDNPFTYADIPYSMVTQEIVNIVINYNPYLLKYTPREFKTKELCTFAVFQNYEYIEFVPNDLENYFYLCKVAVGIDCYAFNYIKLDNIRVNWYVELFKYSASQDYKTLSFIDYKIDEYEGYEGIYFDICKEVLSQNINAIRYIPYTYKRCFELCEYAIHYVDGNAILLISKEYDRYYELLPK